MPPRQTEVTGAASDTGQGNEMKKRSNPWSQVRSLERWTWISAGACLSAILATSIPVLIYERGIASDIAFREKQLTAETNHQTERLRFDREALAMQTMRRAQDTAPGSLDEVLDQTGVPLANIAARAGALVEKNELGVEQALALVMAIKQTPTSSGKSILEELAAVGGASFIGLSEDALRRYIKTPTEAAKAFKELGMEAGKAGISVTRHALETSFDKWMGTDQPDKAAKATASNQIIVNCPGSARPARGHINVDESPGIKTNGTKVPGSDGRPSSSGDGNQPEDQRAPIAKSTGRDCPIPPVTTVSVAR